MRLRIQNFAKISHADLQFKGLTIIAGKNNTGKSTVGKVLYSFYRSFSNIDRRVRDERINAIRNSFSEIPGYDEKTDVISLLSHGHSVRQITETILERFWSKDSHLGVKKPSPREAESMVDAFARNVEESVRRSMDASDLIYTQEIIRRVFECVFHGQYHPLKTSDESAKLQLTVQGEDNVLTFEPHFWRYNCPTKFVNKARIISSPETLSLINARTFDTDKNLANYFDKYTLELAKDLRRQDDMLSPGERDTIKTKLDRIVLALDSVIKGRFALDKQNDFSLSEEGHSVPTKAQNLSMGLKSFVLLRHLLSRGVLRERDVLIFDEPENHLHPSNQILYAKAIVMLQKDFNLTVMVTTHSSYFANALLRFVVTEGISKDTHFYLSKEDEAHPGFCTFEDRGMTPGKIFRSFNEAYGVLSQMSGEFVGDDDSKENFA